MSIVGSSGRICVQHAQSLESGERPAVVALAGTSEHPWDAAHRIVQGAIALEGGPVEFAEPDLIQDFPFRGPDDAEMDSFTAPPCTERGPDSFWSIGAPDIGWHLDGDHSGLKAARERVGDAAGRRVRVGILDTGYDPAHATLPLHLRADLGRNFVDGDPNDATDPGRYHPLNQPGHGTATAALLAGRRVALPSHGFDDFLGGVPHVDVVPIRIADSVIHIRTSSMADGIHYAVDAGCDVVSISMGGVPTRAWAAAVNRAYDAGVAIFAAAGNRIGPSPPTTIVYPARFKRVVAVCGVTADGSPYHRSGIHRHMQGCFGPSSKMHTALAAYTPNAPWARMGCHLLVGFGGGTSSATPQAAAAAALWLQAAAIPAATEPWRKIEAVRWALFSSARKDVPDREKYYGQGLLRARAALDVPVALDRPKTPKDSVSFPWLRSIGVLEALPPDPSGADLMYEVEALQVFLQSPGMPEVVDDADPHASSLSAPAFKRLVDAMRRSPLISNALRDRLNEIHRGL